LTDLIKELEEVSIVQIPDLVNGSFEFVGSLFLVINIMRLRRDKKVLGVSSLPVMFFTFWGIWNLYFYPYLHQTFSFIGGIGVVLVNSVWLAHVAYFKYHDGRAIRSILRSCNVR
jgi:hypothetical protein